MASHSGWPSWLATLPQAMLSRRWVERVAAVCVMWFQQSFEEPVGWRRYYRTSRDVILKSMPLRRMQVPEVQAAVDPDADDGTEQAAVAEAAAKQPEDTLIQQALRCSLLTKSSCVLS